MDSLSSYVHFLKTFLKPTRPMKVVFDCSNGTAGLVLKKLIATSDRVKAVLINDKPDGNFPAHGPDPWKKGALEALGRKVVQEKADCGVIFDADGDRVFFVDDLGRTVGADHTAILIGMAFKGPVVLDLRMGYAARERFAAHKRRVVDSRVGHFFIKKLMRAKKIPYAAELSGHYYFKDFFYCDSGIFAAIQFLNAISNLQPPTSNLSRWIDEQPKYYQSGEINFDISDANKSRKHANDAKVKLSSVIPAKAGIQKENTKELIMKKIEAHYRARATAVSHLDGLKMEFDEFWFSVRPSNTENLLRLNLEAKEKAVFDREMGTIDKLIRSML